MWFIERTVAATNQGKPKTEFIPMQTAHTNKSKWYPLDFLSLFIFLLTKAAVIWWSMKINIVTSNAGGMAPKTSHHLPLFLLNGLINQPLFGIVGWIFQKLNLYLNKRNILKVKFISYVKLWRDVKFWGVESNHMINYNHCDNCN